MAFGFLVASILAAPAALFPQASSALGAGATVGYIATGTATVTDARGTETGTITVETWGASHCKVTLDLSRPAERPRRWVAVLDGRQSQVAAPPELQQALAAPDVFHGCALLPQSAVLAVSAPDSARSAEAPALSVNPATGLAMGLAWQRGSDRVQVGYAGYTSSGGVAYPANVTETISGTVRLTVRFTSLAPKPDFTEADFALPPLRAPATHGYGGGQ